MSDKYEVQRHETIGCFGLVAIVIVCITAYQIANLFVQK